MIDRRLQTKEAGRILRLDANLFKEVSGVPTVLTPGDSVEAEEDQAGHSAASQKQRSPLDSLRRQFRRVSLEAHPDKGGSHDSFVEVQAAYDKLVNKAKSVRGVGSEVSATESSPNANHAIEYPWHLSSNNQPSIVGATRGMSVPGSSDANMADRIVGGYERVRDLEHKQELTIEGANHAMNVRGGSSSSEVSASLLRSRIDGAYERLRERIAQRGFRFTPPPAPPNPPSPPPMRFRRGLSVDIFELCCDPDITAEQLLEEGLREDFRVAEMDGTTPLHVLCANVNVAVDLLRAMGKRGADFNAQTLDGLTPLHVLCRNTAVTLEMLQAMLEFSASFESSAKGATPPLHLLCSNTSVTPAMLSFIAEIGIDFNALPTQCPRALHVLCSNPSITPALLHTMRLCGSNFRLKDTSGSTAFHILCRNTCITPDLMLAMKDLNVNFNEVDSQDETALHVVCRNSMLTPEVLQTMQLCGSNFKAVNMKRQTCLHILCSSTSITPELLHMACLCGVDVNAIDFGSAAPFCILYCNPAATPEHVHVMDSVGAWRCRTSICQSRCRSLFRQCLL